ncbi:MAG: hypothetical protein R2736_03870 [Solirubrobacterales bacterium]
MLALLDVDDLTGSGEERGDRFCLLGGAGIAGGQQGEAVADLSGQARHGAGDGDFVGRCGERSNRRRARKGHGHCGAGEAPAS